MDRTETRLTAATLNELPELLTVEKIGPLSWDHYGLTLTAQQVAEVLQLPVKTVYTLIHRGELAGRKMGREFRVSKDNLRSYVESPAGLPGVS